MNPYETDQSLVHKNEGRYFAIALIFSIMVYFCLLFSLVFIIVIPILFLLPLLAQGIMLASIRVNGVRITPRQFPEVFAVVQEQCSKMGFAVVPDVYVMESSGILNAFASRFFGRNMVVLYSDLFELIQKGGEKELTFVITHELAHIKRNHLTKQLLIIPALWLPFIGEAYSRACEYTCDRMAVYFTNDVDAAMDGLTILAIGKSLYKRVDREEYLLQASYEKGFLYGWLRGCQRILLYLNVYMPFSSFLAFLLILYLKQREKVLLLRSCLYSWLEPYPSDGWFPSLQVH